MLSIFGVYMLGSREHIEIRSDILKKNNISIE